MRVCSSETPIAPFLSKCYDMADDPATDPIISWGSSGTSIVIHDVVKLEQELLPKYYKHRNFSSFVRQLNVYGFKKNDHAREFTNEGFIKGQKHMLRYIRRKKSSQGNCQQDQSQGNNISTRTSSQDCQRNPSQESTSTTRRKSSQDNFESNQSRENNTITSRKSSVGNNQQKESHGNNISIGACVEVGKFKLWEDVENLKKEKNVVMQELAKLRHHQQGADSKLHRLGERLQGMEVSQQHMLSFLAMAVESPDILGQVFRTNESTWRISEINKKRPYLALEQDTDCNEHVASDGQIVRYQPPRDETAKPIVTLPFSWNEHQQFDSSANELDDFFKNIDLMPSVECMALSMEDNGHYENEGQIVIPCSIEDDILDKFLLTSPPPERNETSEADPTRTVENNIDMEITNHNTHEETSQALDRLTEELRHLISGSANEDWES